MEFLMVAGALFLILLLAGWPWVSTVLAYLGVRFARVNVLSWSAPNKEAQGAYLSFRGVEIGHRFFGMVTSREAHVDYPVETPKIVQAKPKIEVVSR